MHSSQTCKTLNSFIDGAVVLDTSLGPLTIDLLSKFSLHRMLMFAFLVRIGYFHGDIFHRFLPNRSVEFGRFVEGTCKNSSQLNDFTHRFSRINTLLGYTTECHEYNKTKLEEREDQFLKYGVVTSSKDHTGRCNFSIFITQDKELLSTILKGGGSVIGIVRGCRGTLKRFENNQIIKADFKGRPLWHICIRAAKLIVPPRDLQCCQSIRQNMSEIRSVCDKIVEMHSLCTKSSGLMFDDKYACSLSSALQKSFARNEKRMRSQESFIHVLDSNQKRNSLKSCFKDDRTIFITRLNPATSEGNLRMFFSQFGEIEICKIAKDRHSGASLQYGFIEFSRPTAAQLAYTKANGYNFECRRIKVDFFHSSKSAL